MLNNKDKQEIFDLILTRAFTEAHKKEMDELDEGEARVPSEKMNKLMKKEFKKLDRQNRSAQKVSRAWSRVAVAAMLVLCISFGSAAAVPGIRASIRYAVLEFFDEYFTVSFRGDTDVADTDVEIQCGDYTLTYLPYGYTLTEQMLTKPMNYFLFSDDYGNELKLLISPSDAIETSIDNEDIELKCISRGFYEKETKIIIGADTDTLFFRSFCRYAVIGCNTPL